MAQSKGDDSDPTRETILSYAKPPRTTGAGRSNSSTLCHHKFAHLVVNYLDSTNSTDIKINEAWNAGYKLCTQVLRSERDRRFAPAVGGETGRRREIYDL